MAGLPVLAAEREASARRWPLVVVGGPLTFSNPVPAGPMADVIIMGEAEDALPILIELVRGSSSKDRLLAELDWPGWLLRTRFARRQASCHPGREQHSAAGPFPIVTPHTELADMFLIEAARGCSRTCTYCVMRRSTNGGMRKVEPDRFWPAFPTTPAG